MQLKAGFFTHGIESLKTSEAMAAKVDSLMEHLSYFDVDTNIEISDTCDDPAVAVIYNMVSRGAPTYASQFVEDILSTTIGKTMKRISPDGTISREIQKKDVRDMVFRALHIIDPRVMAQPVHTSNKKANRIQDFVAQSAVPAVGDYIWQIADMGRRYSDMFKYSPLFRRDISTIASGDQASFLSDKCDLSFCAPYTSQTRSAVTYQFAQDVNGVDTTDYITEDTISHLLDTINVAGRVIVRDKDDPFSKTEELQYFAQSPYFDIIRDNYASPLYNTEDGIEALQLALTPLAIARLQKMVLEAINTGTLSLMAKTWNICVIERDVPCAFLAFRDLQQHFDSIFRLENSGRKFPAVKLEIYHTPEFAETELNLLYQGVRDDISEFNPLHRYDLLIDISVLRRVGFAKEVPPTITDRYAVIRSAKSPGADTRLLFSPTSHYDINISANDCQGQYDDEESDDDDDTPGTYNEQLDSLRFFLKNLFAKNDFLPGQAQTISEMLNGNNVLHISSPSSGKTIMMQLSAMLRPGYTIVLPPTIAVMDSQFRDLRSRRINTCYYVSPVLQNSYSRNQAAQEVMDGHSVITFVSPSLIHDPYIRRLFAGINSRNIPLYFIMLDEAQRISLQTPDFKAYYQDIRNIIARNFSDDNISLLRTGAFTSTMEYNIQNEIAQKLSTDISINLIDPLSVNTDITVHEVSLPPMGNTDDPIQVARRTKQAEAAKIIQPSLSRSADTRAMLLSQVSPFDENDSSGDPILVCGTPTSHYGGDIDDGYTTVASAQAYRSMKSLSDFCSGATRVLSATRSAGMGVHAPGLRNIVHFEPPMSLDAFCRANGRGASSDAPHIHVLLNTSTTQFAGRDTISDTATTLKRLLDQNPGADKEKAILSELLNGVMFPERNDCQNIEEAVFNEFNVEVETDAEPMVKPYQLYIYMNGRTKSLGYIDFKAKTLNMPEMSFDRPLAEKIQSYIYDLIIDNTANPLDYLSTMETTFQAEENDGIQTALDAIMEGRSAEVVIPFCNDSFAHAARIINDGLSLRITPIMMMRCYNSTSTYDQFERELDARYGARPQSLEPEAKARFRAVYDTMRNRRDTLRAVSRLKEIDVIDDYLVNQATGKVTVQLTKHNKDFYRRKLMPILQRNLTRERMLRYISSIDEEKFLSMEKYTNVLIDFFYSEIYPLYEKQATESAKFFMTILDKQKANTISKDQIRDNLQCYFTSRYKCRFVYDEEPVSTVADNTRALDGVEALISKAGSNINELVNLQESIDQTIPENRTPVNKVVYGYCKLFTGDVMDSQERFRAYSHIGDGLAEMSRKSDVEQFDKELDAITDKIVAENYDLKQETEELLPLMIHHNWLKWFNQEVLKVGEGRV